MVYKVFMPKVGMSMETGVINKWLKKVGDPVEKGEPIIEIESDKVSMEIEANESGFLAKIIRNEGETVPVVETIGYIATSMDEKIEDDTCTGASASASAPASAPAATPAGKADYDVIVVGGGPAGYAAAIRSAQLGGRVLLFEKDAALGGTCLNRGCIPTKAYLHSAGVLRTFRTAASCGVEVNGSAAVNLSKVYDNKNKIVKKLTDGVAALLNSNGITVIHAEATIKSGHLVSADNKDYTARSVIFAGGSLPASIPVEGADLPRVLDSTALLELKEVPGRLVIIGGGVIGVEFASAFNEFSSKVTIIEMADQLIPGMDADIADTLKKKLKAQGIAIHTSSTLEKIEDGSPMKVYADGKVYEADYVLMAVGRKPDLSAISGTGAETTRKGVTVDEHMQTSIPDLYAAGDANGRCMLAHAAYLMAECAAENAMGQNKTAALDRIPSCIYTTPEVASIGLTEKDAAAKGSVVTGKFMFAANGRALTEGATDGYVKVVSDAATHEILGVQIIGCNAAEMINTASVMLHLEMTADEMAETIFAHPTCAEALKEASTDSIALSLHNLKK